MTSAPALAVALCADRPELEKLEGKLARLKAAGKPVDRLQARYDALAARSAAAVLANAEALPVPRLNDTLPIAERAEEIVELLKAHQVLVIAGETGSGKTTQLPKLAMAAGLGIAGRIGHTQPRRLAARAVARRLAEELGVTLGDTVGFQTRFDDVMSADTRIKLMTDGILLAETQRDPALRAYDCLIIDEAHERSLNIDFLLGYLARLLPQRPDLKLIITSATIDLERFAAHFARPGPEGTAVPAPIIEVSGRTFPVDLEYLPPEGESTGLEAGLLGALEAIDRLERSGQAPPPYARDVLVFLPGERDIRDAAKALREVHPLRGAEVLPLYARLSNADQQRVFNPGGARRIVLSTNVAETSLTVPRIGYVIDSGLARISRYSYRSKLQRLPVEPISQASAAQRAGRCGRLAPGVCFRLFDQADFEARPAFTDPEIRRTNLASVVLRMKELDLGDPEAFPFLEPPEPKALSDGRRLLQELQALDELGRLTPVGRSLAKLPVDPLLGRMLVAAQAGDVLEPVLAIVTALAQPDVRDRPPDKQQAADQAHGQWRDKRSDFLTLLTLWRWLEAQRETLSASAFRKTLQRHFLSYLRVREWRALHRQLRLAVQNLGWRLGGVDAAPERIHQALLPGLLGQLGLRTERKDYLGARGLRFHIFPGSGVFGSDPPWLMAAEIVETSRVYARTVAAIDPRWIEDAAAHLLRRRHEEPHWRRKQGRVVVRERATLYGLPVVENRFVPYAPIDPEGARAIFLLEGLVRGGLETKGPFLAHNLDLVEQLRELEARERRRDLLVSESAMVAWYGARIDTTVVDARSFEHWRRQAEARDKRVLFFRREDVLQAAPDAQADQDFPGTLELGALILELAYSFSPGSPEDGVTVRVPRLALPQLRQDALDWVVPGFLEDRCVALLKALPKGVRRQLAPVPDKVRALMPSLLSPERYRKGSLLAALTAELERVFGVVVPADAWQREGVPLHLAMRLEVLDEQGKVLGSDRALAPLQQRFGGRETLADAVAAATPFETTGADDWVFGAVAERTTLSNGLQAFPALVDEGDLVAQRLFTDWPEAQQAHRGGVLRLLALRQRSALRQRLKQLPERNPLGLLYAPLGPPEALFEQLGACALAEAHALDENPLPRDEAAFKACLSAGGARLGPALQGLEQLALATLKAAQALRLALATAEKTAAFRDATDDVRAWLNALLPPTFLTVTPRPWRSELPRYLAAATLRLEQLQGRVDRDRALIMELAEWQGRCEALAALGAGGAQAAAELRWWLEEYRVSLTAQKLGTVAPISAKRLKARFEAAEASARLGTETLA